MKLYNRYWLLRHGHSLANAQEIIISTLEEGVLDRWGLSPQGRRQASQAGEDLMRRLKDESISIDDVHFYVSPFSRTIETATLAAAPLSIAPGDGQFHVDASLRERSFGTYEGTSTSNYQAVWEVDSISIDSIPEGDGESVRQVAERLKAFVAEVEGCHRDRVVVVVSHGDALSILAAVLLERDLRHHREYGLKNGQIFEVNKTE